MAVDTEVPIKRETRHGTIAMYQECTLGESGRACRECRLAKSEYEKQRREYLKMGGALIITAERAHEEVMKFVRAGYSIEQIAEACSRGTSTIRKVYNSPKIEIYQSTEDALVDLSVRDLPPLYSAIGIQRRLQALSVAGWSFTRLGTAMDLTPESLRDIATGKRTPRTRVSEIVYRNYPVLLSVDEMFGYPKLVSKRARERGWLPDGVWKDIDNPECKPVAEDEARFTRVS